MNTTKIAPRQPDIDAANAEGLAEIRADRLSPAFESAEAFDAWLETDEGRRSPTGNRTRSLPRMQR